MKTMNRLALVVVSLAIFNIAAVVQADDYTYITNNGTIIITGYTGPGGNVIIPSTIDALPVTAIEDSAFGVRTNLTAVTIPDSVIEIGDYAFSQCVVLTNVVMGGSVASIGEHAFAGCNSLSAMLLPQSLTNFGIAVFSGCRSLRAIEVAPANSFYSSRDGVLFDKSQTLLVEYPSGKGLSYVIPQGVKAIGDYAFFEGSLTNLAIADSVTNVGSSAFAYCTGLSRVQFGNGIITIGDSGFYLCSISSLVIPDSVTSIGNSAFVQYFSLTNLVIGNSVTNIGDGAFGSSSFTTVTIPESVVHLGYAFDLCTLLTAINVAPLNPSYSSVDGVLFDRAQTVLLFHPEGKAGDYTAPKSVTNIAGAAFFRCNGVTNVLLPEGLISIGEQAFMECGNLASVNIPNTVTSLGIRAFTTCTSLSSIKIPSGITNIADYVFFACTRLTNIALPGTITSIGNRSFAQCYSLTNIAIPTSVVSFGEFSFFECYSLKGAYFQGNAPTPGPFMFASDNQATVYHLPGTIGWGTTYGGRPTKLWALPKPVILTGDPSFGIQGNAFGFRISWATNTPVVVEVSTALDNPAWSPVSTNTLTDGWSDFRDPQWANYPIRLYRVRSQ